MHQNGALNSWATSSTLIGRVRAKDKDAWRALVDIYAPLVFSWARGAKLQASDADDIVQEVFRSVSKAFQDFRHGGPTDTFRGWLWTITRNVLRTHLTRERDNLANGAGGTKALRVIGAIPDELPNTEPEVDPSEEVAMLRRALTLVEQDFSEQTWQVFWQFAVNERSAKDVGDEFGMKPEAVRRAKFRVLARLREVLP